MRETRRGSGSSTGHVLRTAISWSRATCGRWTGRTRVSICADFDYRFKLDVKEIYPAQVATIEKAFPAADVQCCVPEAWEDYRE